MSKGISNLEINKSFENKENQDLKKQLYGSLFDWFNYKKYKFLWNNKKEESKISLHLSVLKIFNTDKCNKSGMHW